MKQMHRAWYLIVAVSLLALFENGPLRANTSEVAPTVSLSDSVAAYSKAISGAVNKPNFIDVYNASLPLSSAAPSGVADLGIAVRNNWYRVSPQDLAVLRDGLTGAATRLLQTYKIQSSEFADLYDNNLAFQTTLLSVNDPMRLSETDPVWTEFMSDPTNSSFYNLFMGLRKRRDFFRAAIDPAALATSAVYRPAELAAVRSLLTKPSLPAGAPLDGEIVAISVDVNGGKYFLQVVKNDAGQVVFASSNDPLDQAAQFKFAVDFDRFGIQLTSQEALYLSADNVVGDDSWLPAKKQRATRLGFSGAVFNAASPLSGKFILESARSGTAYVLRSANFSAETGYLKIDTTGDMAIRAVDFNSALNPDKTFAAFRLGDATPITFVKITQLHRTLGSLRSVVDVAARIEGYSKLLDGALIATLADFLLVVSEAQGFVDNSRVNQGAWRTFSEADGIKLMRALIQKFRANMVSVPAGSAASTASTIYAQQNNQISSLEVSLNAGMNLSSLGGRFADGSSIKDMLLVIAGPNGTMLKVGEAGLISAVDRDFVDSAAQFVAEVDSVGNVMFKSVAAGGKYLQAGQVRANVSGWLQKARFDISRASCVRSAPGIAEKFVLETQGSSVGTYSFKNLDSQGYMRVDPDGMLRAVDATNTGSSLPAIKTAQSAFTFIQVDSFIKQLSALRLETQDKIRVDGYIGMVTDILTDQHVDMLLQELDLFVSRAIKSRTQWQAWKTAGIDKLLSDFMNSGLATYNNRTVFAGIVNKLAAGYVEDATQKNGSGLTGEMLLFFKLQTS